MKLTPWFPPEVKPVHVGVYQRESVLPWSLWDGSDWRLGATTAEKAAQAKRISNYQGKSWRGLAEKPEAA